MSQRFNLTAQLQLQAPRNVGQVVTQIRNQLSGITANVQVTGNARNLAVINKQMQGVRTNAAAAGQSVGTLNRNLTEAARRFSVITVATGTMLALARSIKNGVGEAILFERELVKISQVTGKSVQQLQGLTKEVTRLSTSLGANSSDLLNVSRVLAQAGFAAEKTKNALDILAKTTLAATFNNIQDTTEGAIAVLRQFGDEARSVGGDVKFLENTMDAINSVSKKFAVESGDLITVIRRTGGVFEAAGGKVNELIALFTSVRATTRESAETIATGLRTIFTRIQRTDTVDQLRALGIELRNSEGQFVGAYEAVRRLSVGLSSLDPKDFRFSEIVESLGGFRQVGKVIPLIRQFTTAQDALNVAQASSGSVARDAAIAQQSLYQQAQKVGQEFKALMRTFADSSTFRSIATGALALAKAFIKIAEALEPVLPMLMTMIGLKIGRSVGPMIGGLMAGGRGGGGGGRGISRFAGGGHVPGSGSRDTVPAMLTPGEFVIKKSSAKKLGHAKLAAMNSNRYAGGGQIKVQPDKIGAFFLNPATGNDPDRSFGPLDVKVKHPSALKKLRKGDTRRRGRGPDPGTPAFRRQLVANATQADQSEMIHGDSTQLKGKMSVTNVRKSEAIKDDKEVQGRIDTYAASPKAALDSVNTTLSGSISSFFTGGADVEKSGKISSLVTSATKDAMEEAIAVAVRGTAGVLQGIDPIDADEQKVFKRSLAALWKKGGGAIESVEGYIFEGLIAGLTGAKIAGKGNFFDFPSFTGAAKGRLTDLFGNTGISSLIKGEAKRTYSSGLITTLSKGSIPSKILNDINAGKVEPSDGITFANKGGSIGGTDTVPALLTPGEFVVNKSSAQSIGYSNLSKMNQTGVSRFQNGGVVGGIQRFREGGPIKSGSIDFTGIDDFFTKVQLVERTLTEMGFSVDEAAARASKFGNTLAETDSEADGLAAEADGLAAALKNDKIAIRDNAKAKKEEKNATKKVTSAIKQETQELNNSQPGQEQKKPRNTLRSQVAAQIDPIAGAAQSFVFAGAAAAALASQFSGLDEVTKQTITEFSTFMSTFIGLGGTVAQVMTSMATMGAREAAASEASAIAGGLEAETSTASAIAHANEVTAIRAANIGRALAAAAIAGLAVFAALKYFAIRAKAQADAMEKAINEAIRKLSEGGSGTGQADASIEALEKRGESAAFTSAAWAGGVTAGVVGGGTAWAIAAAAGTTAAAWGAALAPFTLGISVAVAALIGLAVAGVVYFSQTEANSNALKEQEASIRGTIEALISLKSSAYDFDQAMKDIDMATGEEPKGRIRRRLDATKELQGRAVGQADVLADLAISKGKGIATSAHFADDSPEAFQFKHATEAIAAEADNLAKKTVAAHKTLDEVVKLDEVQQSNQSHKDLMVTNKLYAESVRSVIDAIDEEAQAKIDQANSQIRAAKLVEKSWWDGGQEYEKAQLIIKAASEDRARAEKRQADRTGDFVKAQEAGREATIKRRAADLAAAQAADQLRKRLEALANFGKELKKVEDSLSAWDQSLNNSMAIIEGNALDVTSPDTGLGNLNEVYDVPMFKARMQNIVDNLPAEARKVALGALKTVTDAVGIMTTGKTNVLDFMGTQSKFKAGPKAGTPEFADFLKQAGITGPISKEVRGAMLDEFEKSLDDNVISLQEFNAIIGHLLASDEIKNASDLLQRANKIRDMYLQKELKFAQQIEKLRDMQIAAEQKVLGVHRRNAELMATATGTELTLGQKGALRTAKAQAGLVGTGIKGPDLVAGDALGARNLILSNNARMDELKKLQKKGELDKKHMTEMAKLNSSTKKASAELDRLADQSERAADIQAEIDKEKAKRETISGIFEDFAFGGLKDRRDMLAGVGGVRQAMATGTVQNQSQSQRALTGQMLDTLADVPIGPGGETGEQIKKWLAANDMVRMGLISMQQRRAILDATTVEEKLIIEMRRLTQATLLAAGFQVDIIRARNAGAPFQEGGPLYGPSHARGGINLEAEGGEFVLRKAAVQKYGVALIDKVNQGEASVYSGTMKAQGGAEIAERLGRQGAINKKEKERQKKIKEMALDRQEAQRLSQQQEEFDENVKNADKNLRTTVRNLPSTSAVGAWEPSTKGGQFTKDVEMGERKLQDKAMQQATDAAAQQATTLPTGVDPNAGQPVATAATGMNMFATAEEQQRKINWAKMEHTRSYTPHEGKFGSSFIDLFQGYGRNELGAPAAEDSARKPINAVEKEIARLKSIGGGDADVGRERRDNMQDFFLEKRAEKSGKSLEEQRILESGDSGTSVLSSDPFGNYSTQEAPAAKNLAEFDKTMAAVDAEVEALTKVLKDGKISSRQFLDSLDVLGRDTQRYGARFADELEQTGTEAGRIMQTGDVEGGKFGRGAAMAEREQLIAGGFGDPGAKSGAELKRDFEFDIDKRTSASDFAGTIRQQETEESYKKGDIMADYRKRVASGEITQAEMDEDVGGVRELGKDKYEKIIGTRDFGFKDTRGNQQSGIQGTVYQRQLTTEQKEADRQQRLKDEMVQDRKDFGGTKQGAEMATINQKQYERSLERDRQAEKRDQEFVAKDDKAKAAGEAEQARNAKLGMVSRGPSFSETPPARRKSEYNPETGKYETTTPQPEYDPKTGGIKINTGRGQIPLSTPSLARSGFELSEQEISKRKRAEEINKKRTEGKADRDKKRQDRIAEGGPTGLTRSTGGGGSNVSSQFLTPKQKSQAIQDKKVARSEAAANEKQKRRDAAATRKGVNRIMRGTETPDQKAARQKGARERKAEELAKDRDRKAKASTTSLISRGLGAGPGATPAARAKNRQDDKKRRAEAPAAPAAQRGGKAGDFWTPTTGWQRPGSAGGLQPAGGGQPLQPGQRPPGGGQPLQPGQRPPGGGKKAVRGPKPRSVNAPGGRRSSRWIQRQKYGIGGGSRQGAAVRAKKYNLPIPQRLQYPQGHGFRQGMGMEPWQAQQPQPFSAKGNIPTSTAKPKGREIDKDFFQGETRRPMSAKEAGITADDVNANIGKPIYNERKIERIFGAKPPKRKTGTVVPGVTRKDYSKLKDKPTGIQPTPTAPPGQEPPFIEEPHIRVFPPKPQTTPVAPGPSTGGLPQHMLPKGKMHYPPLSQSSPGAAYQPQPPPGVASTSGYTTTTTPTSATTGPTGAGAAPDSGIMEKLMGNLDMVSQKFGELVEKFSTLQHNHTFNGEIGIQINIGNKEAIVNEIRKGIEEDIRNEVTRQKDEGFNSGAKE